MEDLTISGSALMLFSGILSAVVAALLACFKLAWSERDRSNARAEVIYGRLREQYDQRLHEMKVELEAISAARQTSDQTILAQLRELTAAVQTLGGC